MSYIREACWAEFWDVMWATALQSVPMPVKNDTILEKIKDMIMLWKND